MTDKRVPQWRAMSATAAGTRHLTSSAPCQDAAAVLALSNGTLIAAVSDGAGSASHSDTGSALAIDAAMGAMEHMAPSLPDSDDALHRAMRAVFRAGYVALLAHADDTQLPLASLNATLSCIIATSDVVVMGQIGDGAVAIAHADGLVELGIRPQRGEYVNSTCFLTQYPYLSGIFETRVVRTQAVGFALLTDGLIGLAFDDAYGRCLPFMGFLGPLFNQLHTNPPDADLDGKLRAFLDRPLIRDKTSDDLSLILALRTDLAFPALHVADVVHVPATAGEVDAHDIPTSPVPDDDRDPATAAALRTWPVPAEPDPASADQPAESKTGRSWVPRSRDHRNLNAHDEQPSGQRRRVWRSGGRDDAS